METQKLEENPIEERVVEQLIKKTDVQRIEGDANHASDTTSTLSDNASLRQLVDALATQIADLQNHL